LGVLAGVAAGAMLGVLFAPAKGSDTRKKIFKKSDDYADELKEKFNEFIEGMSEKIEHTKEDVSEFVDHTIQSDGMKKDIKSTHV
jgi:gas vesicle protein